MPTKRNKPVPISFGHGCAVSDDIFCVASFPDESNSETEYTRMFILNLSSTVPWAHHDVAGRTIISVALRPASNTLPRACYALSDYGQLQMFNSAWALEEEIPALFLSFASGSFAASPSRVYHCPDGLAFSSFANHPVLFKAKALRIAGEVTLKFDINSSCKADNIVVLKSVPPAPYFNLVRPARLRVCLMTFDCHGVSHNGYVRTFKFNPDKFDFDSFQEFSWLNIVAI